MGQLPDGAYAAALASIPGVGPRTLRAWLDATEPATAWGRLCRGEVDRRFADAARGTDVGAIWAAHAREGIDVLVRGRPPYPASLAGDEEAPAVLFTLGRPELADRFPRVAIVGTRTPTRYGLGLAAQLGGGLAAAGVAVVSGLALGIDGAAHEGAVAAWEAGASGGAAPPLAVVAGGLEHPYPRRHALLWRRVAGAGAVLSEAPVGTADLGWRFPQRNRIMAALAEVVVVVECHVTGGSLHTVRAAARRGIPVGAVPGSVRSPASAGTNDLLADGCFVVRDVTDVMVALGLARAASPSPGGTTERPAGGGTTERPAGGGTTERPAGGDAPPAHRAATAPGHEPAAAGPTFRDPVPPDLPPPDAAALDPVAQRVLNALEWEPCHLDDVCGRTSLSVAVATAALERLRGAGRARGTAGWWERV